MEDRTEAVIRSLELKIDNLLQQGGKLTSEEKRDLVMEALSERGIAMYSNPYITNVILKGRVSLSLVQKIRKQMWEEGTCAFQQGEINSFGSTWGMHGDSVRRKIARFRKDYEIAEADESNIQAIVNLSGSFRLAAPFLPKETVEKVCEKYGFNNPNAVKESKKAISHLNAVKEYLERHDLNTESVMDALDVLFTAVEESSDI